MTLIIPKPKPLYAPMLATFGGGSVRGFGRNLPSGGVSFNLTGRVYQSSPMETLRYNASAGINGNNEEEKSTSFTSQSNFPSTIMDVVFSSDDTSVIRLAAVKNSGNVHTVPLDFTSSTTPTNTNHNQFNGTRGLMMLRNGVMVTGNNAHNSLATWKLNTNGTFTNYGNTADNTHFDNVQCIINPNDGAELGDDTHIFVAGSAGGRLTCVRIGGDGSITILQSFTSASGGLNVWMSPMKSTDDDKLRFMAFFAANQTKVLDYSISGNSYTTVANSSATLTTSANGRVTAATPSWGGYTWANFTDDANNQVYRVGKFFQNANNAGFLTTSSYVGRNGNAILAIEDGTSSSGENGHVYWGVYNSGSSPERKLLAATDNDGNAFSGKEASNARLNNGTGFTNGGCIIGERPRYAEMDAKLESTNW